jgi:peroxiredoxin
VKEGALAPAVRLPSTTGDTVDLAAFRGKRNVLLYFYEHAG